MRLFLGVRLVCAELLAALVVTAPAYAMPSSRLVYVRGEGAEACPEAMELRLAVLHRLGYNPFEPNAKQSILVQLRLERERLHANVELIDEQGLSRGSRNLDAPNNSCEELITAAALSISLAIDPERALAQTETPKPAQIRIEPAELPPNTQSFEPETKDAAASMEPATVAPERAMTRELTLSLHGTNGALARPTMGAALGFRLQRVRWSLALEAHADLPVSRSLDPRSTDARFTTWLLMGTLAPCLRVAPLRICGLFGLGVLGASSSGVRHQNADQVAYAAVGLRLGTDGRVSRRLSLGLHVDFLTALSSYRAEFGNSVIWEPNRLAGLFGLDAAWDML